MTQTSSGVEPVFRVQMTRRKKISIAEKEQGSVVASVDDAGIEWVHFSVLHPGVTRWIKATGNTDWKQSPYFGCESDSIDPMFRVRLQGIIQKHIDHSISSTVNLPKDTCKEVISELYMSAWKEKCKGLTIYRDGCREGILISDDGGSSDSFLPSNCPKRPDVLPSDIHLSNIKGDRWVFIVGLLNGHPYEIFGGKAKEIDIPRKYMRGMSGQSSEKDYSCTVSKEVKGVKSVYSLVVKDGKDVQEYNDIPSIFSPDKGTPTRLISMLLRHGVPIEDICEQLRKIPQEDSMMTFEKGIQRVLRKYIVDKTKAKGYCPDCGSILVYEGGCVKCSQCPWTRCD
jgi:ribonucleoside-diphosphate reductase alpha chain